VSNIVGVRVPPSAPRKLCNADVPAESRDVSYAAMRAATPLRSFYFFQRIERLELEARRLATLTGDGPAASAARKQIVNDVATLRHGGEMKSYIDLLFLTLIVVLCISKIVTN
jgi:hypothetical protein